MNLDLIIESVIDPTRDDLDKAVFDRDRHGDYHLKKYHKSLLNKMIDDIGEIVDVKNWFIKGSILSKQWLESTDVDVLIEIDDMSDDEWNKLRSKIDDLIKDSKLPNTKHPIEVFLNRGEYDKDRAEGVYDVNKDKWIKGPYDLSVDIEDYLDEFKRESDAFDVEIGQLKRDVKDYFTGKSLSDDEQSFISDKLKQKITDIDNSVRKIIKHVKEIKASRRKAFELPMDPEEIKEFGNKNKLPVNVVQKLLERYGYIALYETLKEIRKLDNDPKKVDSERERKEVESELNA